MTKAQNLKKFTRLATFYILLFGLYTNLPVTISGKPLFGAIALLAGFVLLLLNLPKNPAFFMSLLMLAVLIIVNMALSPKGISSGKVISSLQLLLSIIAATGVFLEFRKWRARSIERIVLSASIFIIFLGFIESYLGLSHAFSEIRNLMFSGQDAFIYSSDGRDLELHGGVRPTIFTQEPSHPAKFIGVFLACYYIVGKSKYKTPIFIMLVLASLAIVKSPSILLSIPVALYFRITVAETHEFSLKGWLLIAIGAIAFFTIPSWVGYLPFERARAIAAGSDASSIIRLLGPLKISMDILLNYPLFGVGIGGTDAAKPFLLNIYSNFDVMRMERFDVNEEAGWGSALFQGIAFNGVVGSFIFVVLFKKYLMLLELHRYSFVLLTFLIVFSADGAFVIVRPWCYFFIIMAVVHVTKRNTEN
jgi:hypothetical protein